MVNLGPGSLLSGSNNILWLRAVLITAAEDPFLSHMSQSYWFWFRDVSDVRGTRRPDHIHFRTTISYDLGNVVSPGSGLVPSRRTSRPSQLDMAERLRHHPRMLVTGALMSTLRLETKLGERTRITVTLGREVKKFGRHVFT